MKKSKLKLVENGYAYIKGKTNGNKVFGKRDKSSELHTENDDIVHRLIAAVQAAVTVNHKKELRATSSQNSGHQIISNASVGVSTAVAPKRPSQSSWKRSLSRIRRDTDVALPRLCSHWCGLLGKHVDRASTRSQSSKRARRI